MSIQFILWVNKEMSPKMPKKDNHSVCGYKLVFHLEYCCIVSFTRYINEGLENWMKCLKHLKKYNEIVKKDESIIQIFDF